MKKLILLVFAVICFSGCSMTLITVKEASVTTTDRVIVENADKVQGLYINKDDVK